MAKGRVLNPENISSKDEYADKKKKRKERESLRSMTPRLQPPTGVLEVDKLISDVGHAAPYIAGAGLASAVAPTAVAGLGILAAPFAAHKAGSDIGNIGITKAAMAIRGNESDKAHYEDAVMNSDLLNLITAPLTVLGAAKAPKFISDNIKSYFASNAGQSKPFNSDMFYGRNIKEKGLTLAGQKIKVKHSNGRAQVKLDRLAEHYSRNLQTYNETGDSHALNEAKNASGRIMKILGDAIDNDTIGNLSVPKPLAELRSSIAESAATPPRPATPHSSPPTQQAATQQAPQSSLVAMIPEVSDLATRRAMANHQALQQALTSLPGNAAAVDRAGRLIDKAMTADPRELMELMRRAIPHKTSKGWGDASPEASGLVAMEQEIDPGEAWALTPEDGINAAQAMPGQREALNRMFLEEGMDQPYQDVAVDDPRSRTGLPGSQEPFPGFDGEYRMARGVNDPYLPPTDPDGLVEEYNPGNTGRPYPYKIDKYSGELVPAYSYSRNAIPEIDANRAVITGAIENYDQAQSAILSMHNFVGGYDDNGNSERIRADAFLDNYNNGDITADEFADYLNSLVAEQAPDYKGLNLEDYKVTAEDIASVRAPAHMTESYWEDIFAGPVRRVHERLADPAFNEDYVRMPLKYGGQIVDYNQPLYYGSPTYNPIFPEKTTQSEPRSHIKAMTPSTLFFRDYDPAAGIDNYPMSGMYDIPENAQKYVLGSLKYKAGLKKVDQYRSILPTVVDFIKSDPSVVFRSTSDGKIVSSSDFTSVESHDKSLANELNKAARIGLLIHADLGFGVTHWRINPGYFDGIPVTNAEVEKENKTIRAIQEALAEGDARRLREAEFRAELLQDLEPIRMFSTGETKLLPAKPEMTAGGVGSEDDATGPIARYDDVYGPSGLTVLGQAANKLQNNSALIVKSIHVPNHLPTLIRDISNWRKLSSTFDIMMNDAPEHIARAYADLARKAVLEGNYVQRLMSPLINAFSKLSKKEQSELNRFIHLEAESYKAGVPFRPPGLATHSPEFIAAFQENRKLYDQAAIDFGVTAAQLYRGAYEPHMAPDLWIPILDTRIDDDILTQQKHMLSQGMNTEIEGSVLSKASRYLKRMARHDDKIGTHKLKDQLYSYVDELRNGGAEKLASVLQNALDFHFETKSTFNRATQEKLLDWEARYGKGDAYADSIRKLVSLFERQSLLLREHHKSGGQGVPLSYLRTRKALSDRIRNADFIPYAYAMTGDDHVLAIIDGLTSNLVFDALSWKWSKTLFMQAAEPFHAIPVVGLGSYAKEVLSSAKPVSLTAGVAQTIIHSISQPLGFEFDPLKDISPTLFGKRAFYELGDPMEYIAPRAVSHYRSSTEKLARMPEPKTARAKAVFNAVKATLRGREFRDKTGFVAWAITDEMQTRFVSNLAHRVFLSALEKHAPHLIPGRLGHSRTAPTGASSRHLGANWPELSRMSKVERKEIVDHLSRGEVKEATAKYGYWLYNYVVVNRSPLHKPAWEIGHKVSATGGTGSIPMYLASKIMPKFYVHTANRFDSVYRAASRKYSEGEKWKAAKMIGADLLASIIASMMVSSAWMMLDPKFDELDDEQKKARAIAYVVKGVGYSAAAGGLEQAGALYNRPQALFADTPGMWEGLNAIKLANSLYEYGNAEPGESKTVSAARSRMLGILSPSLEKKIESNLDYNPVSGTIEDFIKKETGVNLSDTKTGKSSGISVRSDRSRRSRRPERGKR